MKKIGNLFSDSAKELKKLSTVIIVALMIALGIILGYLFSFQITSDIKIGISFIPNHLVAALFGPVVSGIMGGVADILKFIIKPTGVFSPLWTLNAIVGTMIYGIIFYKKKLTFWRILIAKSIVAVVVNMIMSCLWSVILYNASFWASISAKAIQEVIQVPIQSVIFFLFVKALQKTKVFPQLR